MAETLLERSLSPTTWNQTAVHPEATLGSQNREEFTTSEIIAYFAKLLDDQVTKEARTRRSVSLETYRRAAYQAIVEQLDFPLPAVAQSVLKGMYAPEASDE